MIPSEDKKKYLFSFSYLTIKPYKQDLTVLKEAYKIGRKYDVKGIYNLLKHAAKEYPKKIKITKKALLKVKNYEETRLEAYAQPVRESIPSVLSYVNLEVILDEEEKDTFFVW